MQTCDWEVTADESSGSLRFCRPWCFFNLIKYYFAFKTRLKISDKKLLNFAECIAGKGKFCGRVAAASCAKNYGDRQIMQIFHKDQRKKLKNRPNFAIHTKLCKLHKKAGIDFPVGCNFVGSYLLSFFSEA